MGEHLGDIDLPAKIRNDNKWLKSKKLLVLAGDGLSVWNALYQGHPSAQDGNLFKDNWWQLYRRDEFEYKEFEFTVLSVDATFKQTETSDMVAITLWGLRRNHIYLWKLVNKRMGFVDTCNKIKQLVSECTVDQLLIEDKANGSAIIDTFRYMENMPPIVGINPQGGKYSRAQAVSPFIATGVVHIPTDFTAEEMKDIEWDGREKNLQGHQMFIMQHSRFPFMKHDDMVDSETQAIARLIKLITGEEPLPNRRAIKYVKWYPDMWEDFENMNAMEQEKFIATYGAPLEWANY